MIAWHTRLALWPGIPDSDSGAAGCRGRGLSRKQLSRLAARNESVRHAGRTCGPDVRSDTPACSSKCGRACGWAKAHCCRNSVLTRREDSCSPSERDERIESTSSRKITYPGLTSKSPVCNFENSRRAPCAANNFQGLGSFSSASAVISVFLYIVMACVVMACIVTAYICLAVVSGVPWPQICPKPRHRRVRLIRSHRKPAHLKKTGSSTVTLIWPIFNSPNSWPHSHRA